jgi:hypothetical protein
MKKTLALGALVLSFLVCGCAEGSGGGDYSGVASPDTTWTDTSSSSPNMAGMGVDLGNQEMQQSIDAQNTQTMLNNQAAVQAQQAAAQQAFVQQMQQQ